MAANAEATVTLSLVDRITAPIKRISARIGALTRRIGLDRIAGAAGRLGGSLRGLGDGLAATTGRLSAFLGLLGAGAGGAVATAFSLAQGAADIGDEVAKTARQLGLGAEALQEYRYAAKMSGVDQALLDKGMLRFSANIADAAKGNKALAKDFASLGIRLKDTSGNFRSMDDVFTDTVEAISKLASPMERSRAAMKLFGRSGIDMTRLFEIGADGMIELREEARRTGHVMSQRAADFSEIFGDNVERLQKRLEGLKLFIGVQLMPVMNEMVVGLTEWFDANRALVVSSLQDWVKRLTGFIRALIDPTSEIRTAFREFGETVSTTWSYMKPFVDLLGGPMNTALFTVTAWIVGPMLAALVTIGAAFVNLGMVIMTTPFGWILMGIAAIVAAVYVLYQRWDEFAAYWDGLWGRVKEAFNQGFIHGVIALLKEFNPVTHIARGINAVIEYFTGINLMDEGSRLIQSLTAGISAEAQRLGEFIDGAFTAASERVKAAFDEGFIQGVNALLTEFNPVHVVANSINALIAYLTGVDLMDEGRKLIASMVDGVKSMDFAQAIVETVSGAWTAYEEWWNGFSANVRAAGAAIVNALWEGLKSAWGSVVAWFKGAVAELIGWLPASLQKKLGFNVDATVSGPAAANDNAARAGAAVGALAGDLSKSVPTGASEAAAAAANDNGGPSTSSGDVNTEVLSNSQNNIDASVHVGQLSVSGGSGSPGEVAAAVRAELSALSRRNAAAAQSSLSD